MISLKGSLYEKSNTLVGIYRDQDFNSSRSMTLDVSATAACCCTALTRLISSLPGMAIRRAEGYAFRHKKPQCTRPYPCIACYSLLFSQMGLLSFPPVIRDLYKEKRKARPGIEAGPCALPPSYPIGLWKNRQLRHNQPRSRKWITARDQTTDLGAYRPESHPYSPSPPSNPSNEVSP